MTSCQENSKDTLNWAIAVSIALLVQPSFVSSEGVFSLLKTRFDEQQDYLESSLILQLNSYRNKNIAHVTS